jgi:hypothetical protein
MVECVCFSGCIWVGKKTKKQPHCKKKKKKKPAFRIRLFRPATGNKLVSFFGLIRTFRPCGGYDFHPGVCL